MPSDSPAKYGRRSRLGGSTDFCRGVSERAYPCAVAGRTLDCRCGHRSSNSSASCCVGVWFGERTCPAPIMGVVCGPLADCVAEDGGLSASIVFSSLRVGLAIPQSIVRAPVEGTHSHLGRPAVDMAGDRVFHAVATRDALPGSITPDFAIVARHASNRRALPLLPTSFFGHGGDAGLRGLHRTAGKLTLAWANKLRRG